MVELLAPAGNMECLQAAVNNGADAVYIGGRNFSARAFAENFGWDEMRMAADYCHLRGVNLYVTLNTMMLEEELASGIAYAKEAYLAGADALIVADIGLAAGIKQCFPDIKLHASTQMCIHNLEGAKAAGVLGIERVVLARELSLADIREITAVGGIKTEVFIHGALCSGVSGLCLLSSFIGERSGNRGKCAQPCRLEYEIGEKNAYYLSMADLCAADLLPELVSAGVSSFKIEGRMKNSQYVGGVVREYRRILNAIFEGNAVGGEYISRLEEYYNRTFTDDYLRGGTNVTATDRPGNRNIDKEKMSETRIAEDFAFYNHVEADVHVEAGQPAEIRLTCGEVHTCTKGEGLLETGRKPFDSEIVIKSLEKTGGTPFKMDQVNIFDSGNPFIRVSEMNALRSKAIADMENAILAGYRSRQCVPCKQPQNEKLEHCLSQVYVQTGNIETARLSLEMGAGRIYYAPAKYDLENLMEAKKITSGSERLFLMLPPFLRQEDMRMMDELLQKTHTIFGGALAGNFSQIGLLKKYFKTIIADYTCNIANGATAAVYKELGCTGITISAELNRKSINRFDAALPAEMVAYGNLPLMWLAHPLLTNKMRDRKGYTYKIDNVEVSGKLDILRNPVLLFIREIQPIAYHIDALRLLLEKPDEAKVLAAYLHAVANRDNVEPLLENTTQGHLKRGV